jgi:hypothetical protein
MNELRFIFITSAIEILSITLIIVKGYSKYLKSWLKNKTLWDSDYDRIRLFINLLFFCISIFVFNLSFKNIDNFQLSLFHKISFYLVPILLAMMLYFIKMSWSKKFEIKPNSNHNVKQTVNPIIDINNLNNASRNSSTEKDKKERMSAPLPKQEDYLGETSFDYNDEEYEKLYIDLYEKIKKETYLVTYCGSNTKIIDFKESEKDLIKILLNDFKVYSKIFEKEKFRELIKIHSYPNATENLSWLLFYQLIESFYENRAKAISFFDPYIKNKYNTFFSEINFNQIVIRNTVINSSLNDNARLFFETNFENTLLGI